MPIQPVTFNSIFKLKHAVTGCYLAVLDKIYPNSVSRSMQHMVVTVADKARATDWKLDGRHGNETAEGTPIDGDVIRLMDCNSKMCLHSHATSGYDVPIEGMTGKMQEVTAYEKRDENDDWQLQIVEDKSWSTTSKIRLLHVNTTKGLRSNFLHSVPLVSHPEFTNGEQAVICTNDPSELSEWIIEDIRTNHQYAMEKIDRTRREPAESLDLSYLNLESLPREILEIPLRQLELKGNPKVTSKIPTEVLQRPPEEIVRYYLESQDGLPLKELKLLVVGRGKAGKTTLLKSLARLQPDPNESETHSIAIKELPITCQKGEVQTRAWDFGGQEILHATHQFFLTERSLYLLVLDPREDLALNDAEYWLKLVETQGGRSPVIVVMNKSHDRPWRVDEVKLKRKFPFIVSFVATDAIHGDGIQDLRDTISKTVENMPHVWLPFPKRWRAIKDAIARMQKNFLTYEEYTSLCKNNGELDEKAQEDLAGILHALGLALYFGKDPRL